jgi:hypothetical protein
MSLTIAAYLVLLGAGCGAEGMPGPQGPSGASGEEGPQGVAGPTGNAGQDGQAGAPGAPGLDGTQGSAGQCEPGVYRMTVLGLKKGKDWDDASGAVLRVRLERE